MPQETNLSELLSFLTQTHTYKMVPDIRFKTEVEADLYVQCTADKQPRCCNIRGTYSMTLWCMLIR